VVQARDTAACDLSYDRAAHRTAENATMIQDVTIRQLYSDRFAAEIFPITKQIQNLLNTYLTLPSCTAMRFMWRMNSSFTSSGVSSVGQIQHSCEQHNNIDEKCTAAEKAGTDRQSRW
jgi:hypothetical protein